LPTVPVPSKWTEQIAKWYHDSTHPGVQYRFSGDFQGMPSGEMVPVLPGLPSDQEHPSLPSAPLLLSKPNKEPSLLSIYRGQVGGGLRFPANGPDRLGRIPGLGELPLASPKSRPHILPNVVPPNPKKRGGYGGPNLPANYPIIQD
jgi:hypothetical protein